MIRFSGSAFWPRKGEEGFWKGLVRPEKGVRLCCLVFVLGRWRMKEVGSVLFNGWLGVMSRKKDVLIFERN